jgi:hypothetical protein
MTLGKIQKGAIQPNQYIYREKGDLLECASYTVTKLLEQAMKLDERALKTRTRNQIKVDR